MAFHLPHLPLSGTAANPRAGRDPSAPRRSFGLLAGIAVFIAVMAVDPPQGLAPEAWTVAAVGALMATWWVLEAIPIAATALVPLALFPLLGVRGMAETAAPFANPLIFLFLGGFVIALAMERWNLHRRIALAIVARAGLRPANLIAGFMGATGFLSMWVSNTATATMMLPIGLSVSALVREAEGPGHEAEGRAFTIALLLAIAFSASIGGVATLIGTPPNALLAAFFAETYGREIGFGRWMLVGLPISAVLMLTAWWLLTRVAFRLPIANVEGAEAVLEKERIELGAMGAGEILTACIFALTAAAWALRPLLEALFPGLQITDPGIAVIAALVIFATPADPRRKVFLLEWSATQRLPWGVLILVGGGLSLGAAITETGLSDWLAAELQGLAQWPVLGLVAALAFAVMVISHLTSNTATAAAFLPLVAALAVSLGENPLLLAVPTVLAASCAFMMPVATPPNAIVFASGEVSVLQMARAGAMVNTVALVLVVLAAYTLVPLALGVSFGEVPAWALRG